MWERLGRYPPDMFWQGSFAVWVSARPLSFTIRHYLRTATCSRGGRSCKLEANDPELHEERQTGLASRHAGKSYKTHLDTPLEELL